MKKNLIKKMIQQNVLLVFFYINTGKPLIKFHKIKISI
jgi:hypothetical protein